MNTPCHDCQDRHETCHATCERYAEYDQRRKEIRQARAESNNKYRKKITKRRP